MEDEEYEYYEEVPTEEDYTEDDSFTANDAVFILTIVLAASILLAVTLKMIKKTFKNVHLKVGDKLEIGVETKDNKS